LDALSQLNASSPRNRPGSASWTFLRRMQTLEPVFLRWKEAGLSNDEAALETALDHSRLMSQEPHPDAVGNPQQRRTARGSAETSRSSSKLVLFPTAPPNKSSALPPEDTPAKGSRGLAILNSVCAAHCETRRPWYLRTLVYKIVSRTQLYCMSGGLAYVACMPRAAAKPATIASSIVRRPRLI
jgi:hypothetical protein